MICDYKVVKCIKFVNKQCKCNNMDDLLFNKIVIEGLFGKPYLNYSLPFEHEKKWLVLNAANGRGKTTLLRTLYHYLSGQWEMITAQQLLKVFIEQNGEIKRGYSAFKTKDCNFIDIEIQNNYYKGNPTMRPVLEELFKYPVEVLQKNPNLIRELAIRHGAHQLKFEQVVKNIMKNVFHVGQVPLEGVCVLFLPTYRRIERNTEEVFPNFVNYLTGRLMDNVEALKYKPDNDEDDNPIFDLESIDDFSDVVSQQIDAELHFHCEKAEDKLEEPHIRHNREQVMAEIEQYWDDYHNIGIGTSKDNKVDYQVLVGFGMKDIERKIKAFSLLGQEDPPSRHCIEQWRDICNKYFFKGHKTLHYSVQEHKVYVTCDTDSGNIHSLNILSSGEKQIAALFAHVLLSKRPVFLLFDEPELSLSEHWQNVMMDELSKLSNLAGMVVATHSSIILKYAKGRYTQTLEDLQISSAY